MDSRLRRAWRWFGSRYLLADPRTLGWARIAIGLLLCADTLRHWAVARVYYSNEGVLPNDVLLRHPSSDFNFSLFSAFSSPAEVNVAFAAALLCHACFAIGWHTRVFSILACLWATSLDQRLVLVENGGYVVVNLLTFWLAFLPSGRRFSIDAWRRARREHRPATAAHLQNAWRPEWWTAPHRSLASFVVVANLAVVYIFNVVNKYGETWRTGETVQAVLHLDRMVTGLGVLLREHAPYRMLQAASWFTLVVEAVLAAAILWPEQRRFTRPLAMALMWALHGTFGVLMRLGPFSWFMMAWAFLLLQRTHWEALEAWHRARFGGVTLALHPSRPLALRLGRTLARLDTTGSLRFVVGAADGPLLATERNGTVRTGLAAWRESVRALPLGALGWGLVQVGSLGSLGRLVARLERHPESVERFFGWDRPETGGSVQPGTESFPFARWSTRLREAVIALVMLCSLSALLHDNKSVSHVLKHPQPKLVRAIIGYPRLFQGWGMFAPNPVREDGIVAVEGWTIDGRRVDPFTGGEPDLDLSDARGLGLGQIEQDYFNRIRLDRNRVYHKALSAYLQGWHRRTGREADALVGFNVYWLRDRCPVPGRLTPTDHEAICLISWRKPGYRPAPGLAAPPPRCTESSADKKD